jgi:hypothetical protein
MTFNITIIILMVIGFIIKEIQIYNLGKKIARSKIAAMGVLAQFVTQLLLPVLPKESQTKFEKNLEKEVEKILKEFN